MSTVTIDRATDENKHIVAHMFVAFFYDLTQYDDNLVINAHGLPVWAPNGLPGPTTIEACARYNWWVRDECEQYIIRVDGNPAGFATVSTLAKYLAPGIEFELLDFYIAPKYRQQGIGRQAARLIFATHHGYWQVLELHRNIPAITFWHKIIGEYSNGNYEDLDSGAEQRFRN